jgi:hypothetical protein
MKEMKEVNDGVLNRKLLYHGASAAAIASIVENGFATKYAKEGSCLVEVKLCIVYLHA